MVPTLYGVSENATIGMYIVTNKSTSQSAITGYSDGAFRMTTAFTATTGKLLSLQNNYVEKFSVDYAGAVISASTMTMAENINTNLRIPKVAPTSPTSGEYYFFIVK